MTRLLRRTIKGFLLVGIALMVVAILGLVGSASGQGTLPRASAQVFKSDANSSSFGEAPSSLANLIADNKGDLGRSVAVNLPVGDKIGTTANGSEMAANADVAVPSRPNVELLNSVMPSGAQPAGTDLVFTVAFTNSGGQAAQVFTVVDPIPAQTDFKIDSPSAVLGTTGMTPLVEYSNDNASTWTYTPVSGGGGALCGYDRLVTHVRWRFDGHLSQVAPDNSGSVAVTARIR